MLAWIVYLSALAAVCGLIALGLERLSRACGWCTRWVWIGAIVSPLLIPAVLLGMQGAEEPAPAATGASLAGLVAEYSIDRTEPVANSAVREIESAMDALFLLGALAASAILMCFLLRSWLRLRRAAASWKEAHIAGTAVLVAHDLGPAVIGFIRPRIAVPQWLLETDVPVRRMAVLHEQEHLSAHDQQLLLAALACVVLMPWNLPLWWLLRRLRMAVEIDCDSRVLSRVEDPAVYGGALLEVAQRAQAAPLLAAALTEPESMLERRIRLMGVAGRLSRPSAALITAVALTLAGAAAAQVEPPASMKVGSALTALQVAAGQRGSGPELLDAIIQGNTGVAAQFIQSGADPDYCRLGDGTPLIVAARNGNQRLIELLLEGGADVNRNCLGDGNPLIVAAGSGHARIVAMLAESGADVNAFVEHDETPLINAARGGNLEIVQYLVDKGVDINFSVVANRSWRPQRRSALSEAERYGHRAVAEYLRARGATS